MSDDAPLLALLQHLDAAGYRFVTPTPETHRRVVGRRAAAKDLRDIFGWSLPFERSLLPPELFESLQQAELLDSAGRVWRSRIRVSSLDDHLLLHSAYPTEQADAVFFGPDTYRFANFLKDELRGPSRHLVDLGTGSGAGAILAAVLVPEAKLTLVDINPLALRFARINARHAGLDIEAVEGGGLDAVKGRIDLVIANPPYMIDPAARAYRHGGEMHGARLSLDWAQAAAHRLEPGGRMLLYTGSAIVDGHDALRVALLDLPGCTVRYQELDPDVFGEQLDQPGYEDVERIAAIGAVIERG